MITIKSGQMFCSLYNKEHGTALTPKQVFTDIIVPLLIHDGNGKAERKLISWGNTRFFQRGIDIKRGKYYPLQKTVEEFCELVENYDCNLETMTNTYLGCATPNNKDVQTTEYAYCDNIHLTIDERYCSWIGSLFAPCVSGGFLLQIFNGKLIMKMFDGIKAYRKWLDNNGNAVENQLPAWLGHYLYNEYVLQNQAYFSDKVKLTKNGTKIDKPIQFEQLIHALSKCGENINMIWPYKAAQTNMSSGPIILQLADIQRLYDVSKRMFNTSEDDIKNFEILMRYFSDGKENRTMDATLSKGHFGFQGEDPETYLIKLSRNEDFASKHPDIFKKILEMALEDQEKTLADKFVREIISWEGKTRKTISSEIEELLQARDIIQFDSAITKIEKQKGIQPDESTMHEIVQYIASSKKIKEFLTFVKLIKKYTK